jgi:hypothetical protein
MHRVEIAGCMREQHDIAFEHLALDAGFVALVQFVPGLVALAFRVRVHLSYPVTFRSGARACSTQAFSSASSAARCIASTVPTLQRQR